MKTVLIPARPGHGPATLSAGPLEARFDLAREMLGTSLGLASPSPT
jgi:hypothetical protein